MLKQDVVADNSEYVCCVWSYLRVGTAHAVQFTSSGISGRDGAENNLNAGSRPATPAETMSERVHGASAARHPQQLYLANGQR
jgi:hypothetical protein